MVLWDWWFAAEKRLVTKFFGVATANSGDVAHELCFCILGMGKSRCKLAGCAFTVFHEILQIAHKNLAVSANSRLFRDDAFIEESADECTA